MTAPSMGNERLDVARLRVLVVAGQARLRLHGVAREDGDAVERLLAMDGDIVAGRLDLQPRERLLQALDLLQANDVGLGLLQPGEEVFEALTDRVDVPGCNSHGDSTLKAWRA